MPFLISFFNLKKPRGYNYRPIYFDPVKEEIKERLKKLQAERELEEADRDAAMRSSRISYAFDERRNQWHEERAKKHRNQTVRFIIILAALILIVLAVIPFMKE